MGGPDKRLYKAVMHYFNGVPDKRNFNKSMIAAGYSKDYATQEGGRIFKSPKVQNILAGEQAKIDAENAWTVEKATEKLNELKKKCTTANDRQNMVNCIKELNKLWGLYKEEAGDINTVQEIVSPEERKKALKKELELLDKLDEAPYCIATD